MLLSLSDSAFSPNNDKVKDTVQFLPVLKDASGIESYDLVIRNAKNTDIRTIHGTKSLPASLSWDGKDSSGIVSADGTYHATLIVMTTNGNMISVDSSNFVLDTVSPYLAASAPWSAFSPDGDGIQDTIPVTITGCTQENLWTAEIKDSK
ncbi:MAG: hypothetical protein L6V86_01655 [Treponema sp.]|nr:MAG: hypothetical protein L6V86_01655 [Treponema sp.]